MCSPAELGSLKNDYFFRLLNVRIEHPNNFKLILQNPFMEKSKLIGSLIESNRLANRRLQNPNSCPCYNGNSCHPNLDDSRLICLFCICPYYDNNTKEGGCNVNSQYGKWFYHKNLPKGRIWDCSDCEFPHIEKNVRIYLESFSVKQLEELNECDNIKNLLIFFRRNL